MANPQKPPNSPPALTSLDKSKSYVDPRVLTHEASDFFMGDFASERAAVLTAFVRQERKPKTITRFENCCRKTIVLINEQSNDLRYQKETCGSRYCPHCGPIYRAGMAMKIEAQIDQKTKNIWRFITLTLEHNDAPLDEQLDHLTASFRRLRQTVLWKSTQLKGYGVIEVKRSGDNQTWHPHIHVLTRGLYLPQAKLSEQWNECSGGSSIVDVRGIDSHKQAIKYVTKYLGKTPEFVRDHTLFELTYDYIEATTNRRLIITFGVKSIPDDWEAHGLEDEPKAPWKYLMPLQELIAKANKGDPRCSALLEQLIRGGKYARQPSLFDE